MHLEILVEDQSGKKALDILVPKIIGESHTFRIHPYKGLGRIQKGLKGGCDASNRILLEQLPKLLRGYGKTFLSYPEGYSAAVILVADLDNKSFNVFRRDLHAVLDACESRPETRFCIAIEEGEAWFLGDIPAIKAAYPNAKDAVMKNYENDAICGTWELLADAITPGGAKGLLAKGWQSVGAEKSMWSRRISPHMTIDNNASPSFVHFRTTLRKLAGKKD